MHRGVYVSHTGPLTWVQRLWAALLHAAPAVAADESALILHGLARPDALAAIHVAVAPERRLQGAPGIVVHRISHLDRQTLQARSPARLRLEAAVLRTASRAPDEATAVGLLADAVRSRRTTTTRLASSLEAMSRLKRRQLLREVLVDVEAGATSVLEHRYLSRVERAHGLPRAIRQRRVKAHDRVTYRDVEYLDGAVIVELDGRLGHEQVVDRWADLERDIASAVSGSITLRLGWLQVLSPCRVAVAVGRLLQHSGWRGRLTPCGPRCLATSLNVSA